MNSISGIEYFEELLKYHYDIKDINSRYFKMRSLLENICKEQSEGVGIEFTSLFTRLNYVCKIKELSKGKTYQINTFRIHANKIIHSELKPTEEIYLQDLRAFCHVISHFYEVRIPDRLKSILPDSIKFTPSPILGTRIRVQVISWDTAYIYAIDSVNETNDEIKIKYNIPGVNDLLNASVSALWEGCLINLIDVTIGQNGDYIPTIIVIEPDYLMDVSSIAENFKDYGSDPLNYFMSKFESVPNNPAIIIGNFANNVLDEFLYDDAFEIVNLKHVFKKTFKQYPFEFTTCKELLNEEKESAFKQEIGSQFLHIKDVVQSSLSKAGIDRNKAILEPSFICEALGILEEGYSNLIELKSGKGDDFGKPLQPKENHQIQLLLYLGILQYNLGKKYNEVKSYLLYSKYPNLYYSSPTWNTLKKVINIRNLIVAHEYRISTVDQFSKYHVIDKINPESLNVKGITGPLWNNYIRPQISKFKSVFENSSNLELSYFHSFYSFVTKEHYLSKLQVSRLEDERDGSYWTDFYSKKEAGEILYDLSIKPDGNKANDESKPTITFVVPNGEIDILPNFREGDIVIVYERNEETDNVTNKQVFKGAIETINPSEVSIRLRSRQRNVNVLPIESKYAIEHDFMDSSYISMYRGLYTFLQANPDRKNLLLGQNGRGPQVDNNIQMITECETEEISEVVYAAKQAKDFFLLVGPPGTGKTSKALKAMVTEFYSDINSNILLLAYTNRAVDEICDALEKIEGSPSYIRIGSELSCDKKYQSKLLQESIKHCENRVEVKNVIENNRIFVGTVASVATKSAIFELKTFDVAIVDEASQILEPSIIGILCAKNGTGHNAIQKFILIGDHKQLPAVVIQSPENSMVKQSELIGIGLKDRRNSFFERLYDLYRDNKNLCHRLYKQGRMHEQIAMFPSYSFYNNKLELVPTSHQKEEIAFKIHDDQNPIQKLLSQNRLIFIPSEENKENNSSKTNLSESHIVVKLVQSIKDLCTLNDFELTGEETKDARKMSIGIITPYRKQIALIKKTIHQLNDPDLDTITVDTVERYQGSQRDIIIYSFCVNNFRQIKNLTNNIEDEGQTIDRKLNVALTRAKKHLFITGNPDHLSSNLIYFTLIEFIRSKGGYVNTSVKNFLSQNFEHIETNTDSSIGNEIYTPDTNFRKVFENLVINPLKEDERTISPFFEWHKNILGNTSDYNRMNLIGYGRADFSSNQMSLFGYSLMDKVNLYCYYNMRKHYFSSMAIFNTFREYFEQSFLQNNGRILFIDFGCGPLTSGLAFNQCYNSKNDFSFDYLGIDISQAMLEKAKEFAISGLFHENTKFVFRPAIEQLHSDFWENQFMVSNVVLLNFSYLFGNLSNDDASKLAIFINTLMETYPINRYVLIYQNSSMEKRNKTYHTFKKLVPGLSSVSKPRTERVVYSNSLMSYYDNSEDVYYEILSN